MSSSVTYAEGLVNANPLNFLILSFIVENLCCMHLKNRMLNLSQQVQKCLVWWYLPANCPHICFPYWYLFSIFKDVCWMGCNISSSCEERGIDISECCFSCEVNSFVFWGCSWRLLGLFNNYVTHKGGVSLSVFRDVAWRKTGGLSGTWWKTVTSR